MCPELNGWVQKKRLGQVFLKDTAVAEKIVELLKITYNDKILEIGPGVGILTEVILRKSKEVMVFEKDIPLGFYMKKRFPPLKVVIIDVLDFLWKRLKGINKVIGNLPYNIASKIIWDIVSSTFYIDKMVFTVQKEVAERIIAPVGSKKYGLLSVWVQHFADVKYEFTIGANSFSPKPKVNSAVISIYPKNDKSLFKNKKNFTKLIKKCFQNRRKQLKNILKTVWSSDIDTYLIGIGFNNDVRPEKLSSEQFYRLSCLIK